MWLREGTASVIEGPPAGYSLNNELVLVIFVLVLTHLVPPFKSSHQRTHHDVKSSKFSIDHPTENISGPPLSPLHWAFLPRSFLFPGQKILIS